MKDSFPILAFIIGKRQLLSLLVFCLVAFETNASGDITNTGARQAGMAGTSVMLRDYHGLSNNPATLAFLQQNSFGIYHENKFLVKELSFQHMGLALPTKYGVIGADFSYYGFSQYNEKRAGLAYALKLHKSFSVGIKLNYLQTHIAGDYGKKGVVFGEIGIFGKPTEKLVIGIHVINPTNQKLTTYPEEVIPSVYKFGMGYYFTNKLLIAAEVEKASTHEMQVKSGLDFELVESFFLRLGIANNPQLVSFGFGYHREKFNIDLAFSRHELLGFSPHISMTYNFGKVR